MAAFGSPSAVLAASRSALIACLGNKPALIESVLGAADSPPEADLSWLAEKDARHALLLDHVGYPPQLAEISDPPLVLLVEGRAELLSQPQLAIVGSRNASPAGREIALAMAAALADAGLVVTSGLAEGVDGAAHRGALRNGTTIAVLGTGPDRTYPRQHADLAQQIRDHGALVSEQPVGTPPRGFNFPRRNRIISGLSLGVLVVEAGPQSGSLITARQAAEQGREVFAVPGGIHNPLARGCHALIRDGAKLVESVKDILEDLPPWAARDQRPTPPPAAGLANRSDNPLLAYIGDSPVSVDLLVARTGLTVAEVSTMLLMLQLDGLVTALPGGLFGRHGSHPAR